MDTFIEYASIENHYQTRTLDLVRRHDNGTPWCATEKVHGSNFSATTDGVKVKWGKRSSYIGDAGLCQFNNSHFVKDKYQSCILALFQTLQSTFGYQMIRVFGELCGGKYTGVKSTHGKPIKPVQQGVEYCPNIEFVVFDIVVCKDKDSKDKDSKEYAYLDVTDTIRLCAEHGLVSVKILHTGSLDDMLMLNPEFDTTVPEYWDLSPLPNNYAEGYVIRPISYYHTPIGRLILKHKSKRFSEKSEKKIKTSVVNLNHHLANKDDVNEVVDEICTYINSNRRDCVMSKMSEDEKQNTKIVRGMVIKDALNEFKSTASEDMVMRFDKFRAPIMNLVMGKFDKHMNE